MPAGLQVAAKQAAAEQERQRKLEEQRRLQQERQAQAAADKLAKQQLQVGTRWHANALVAGNCALCMSNGCTPAALKGSMAGYP